MPDYDDDNDDVFAMQSVRGVSSVSHQRWRCQLDLSVRLSVFVTRQQWQQYELTIAEYSATCNCATRR